MSFLDRGNTIAGPGFNRWMVPPAALCVHLCIGQAYAFSVFNLPMTKLIGVAKSAPGDWNLPELGWIFSIAIFFLGVSSAIFGRWVERAARAAPCSPRPAAGPPAFSFPPSASTSTICGPSISVMASSAASRSASATCRRCRP